MRLKDSECEDELTKLTQRSEIFLKSDNFSIKHWEAMHIDERLQVLYIILASGMLKSCWSYDEKHQMIWMWTNDTALAIKDLPIYENHFELAVIGTKHAL